LRFIKGEKETEADGTRHYSAGSSVATRATISRRTNIGTIMAGEEHGRFAAVTDILKGAGAGRLN
jgi:hypothetical protein